MPTTQYYDFVSPVARPTLERRRTVSRLRRCNPCCNPLGPVACRAVRCIRCNSSGTAPLKFWSLMSPFVWGRPATIFNDAIYSTASMPSSKSSLAALQREPELAIQTLRFDTYHRQGAPQYYRQRLLPLYLLLAHEWGLCGPPRNPHEKHAPICHALWPI